MVTKWAPTTRTLSVGVSGPIRLGVCISHEDVNNDIRPTGPEASNEEISPLFVV
jgi:hypothetical protein